MLHQLQMLTMLQPTLYGSLRGKAWSYRLESLYESLGYRQGIYRLCLDLLWCVLRNKQSNRTYAKQLCNVLLWILVNLFKGSAVPSCVGHQPFSIPLASLCWMYIPVPFSLILTLITYTTYEQGVFAQWFICRHMERPGMIVTWY